MVDRLKGKVALITGGGSGIGRATAQLFAAEGAAAVVLVDRDGDGAKETAALLPDGCAVETVEADVTDVEMPGHTVAAATERFGRIDVLMTAAGLSVGRALVDTTPDEWDFVFGVNVKGTYLWMRAVLPSMVEQGSGSIVTVASQLAVNGGRANTAYIASKGAVIAMTRTTALDVAKTGVRVNSILPGATETPLLDRSFGRLDEPERARAASLARHPMGRFGRADEIAKRPRCIWHLTSRPSPRAPNCGSTGAGSPASHGAGQAHASGHRRVRSRHRRNGGRSTAACRMQTPSCSICRSASRRSAPPGATPSTTNCSCLT